MTFSKLTSQSFLLPMLKEYSNLPQLLGITHEHWKLTKYIIVWWHIKLQSENWGWGGRRPYYLGLEDGDNPSP